MKEKLNLILQYTENGWIINDELTSKVYVCEKEDKEGVFASTRLSNVLNKIMQARIDKTS